MKRKRKAKILSTLGPASSSAEIIEKLFVEGTDVFRLNFSHGSIEEHRKNFEIIRNLEKKYEYSTCIIADLQGPKLRIGAFKNKKECLMTINKLINRDIKLRTLTGFFAANDSTKANSSVFHILYELDNLEDKSLGERKKEQLLRRKLSGNNLGGRPKISPLKESLVIRLRNEGYSYRSIRSQTGIALSTIRRVILEGELT